MACFIDLRERCEAVLSDYTDFGEEYERLMAIEIADAAAPLAPERPFSLLEAIQDYLSSVERGDEKSPSDIGGIEGYGRRSVIDAALLLAVAKAIRHCKRRSPLAIAMLLYIALRSDNEHGRCTDSVFRQADYLGCAEDVVRDLRKQLVEWGCLRSESRPGKPAALWLPYAAVAVQNSVHSILLAMAPARSPAGRPRKAEPQDTSQKRSGIRHPTIIGETPGTAYPTISEKGRVLDEKRSGVGLENPGYLMPDSKNSSLQDLARTHSEVSVANSRSQRSNQVAPIIDEVEPAKRKGRETGKRPWSWVHDSEKRELLERCKSFAEQQGWSEDFLAGRLEAFALRQSSRRFASADWWAELKLWLSSPAHQPRATRFTSSSTDRTEGTRQRLGWGSE